MSITIGTDDPSMFNTTLTDELRLLNQPLGLQLSDMDTILTNSIEASFLGATEKDMLKTEFAAESHRAKERLGLTGEPEGRKPFPRLGYDAEAAWQLPQQH